MVRNCVTSVFLLSLLVKLHFPCVEVNPGLYIRNAKKQNQLFRQINLEIFKTSQLIIKVHFIIRSIKLPITAEAFILPHVETITQS